MKRINKQQQGFTLFELLVVVSVLAAMASIAAVAVDGYEQAAEDELVHVEMKRIASAIYRFKQDTGEFPNQGVFASTDHKGESDLHWLFSSPEDASDNEIMPWNINTEQGWNGPYLTMESSSRYVEGECDLDEFTMVGATTYLAIEDTFVRLQKYQTGGHDDCFALRKNGKWTGRNASGQPYQYQVDFKNDDYPDCPTSGSGCIALLSAGSDGAFAANPGDGDDIVKILGVN